MRSLNARLLLAASLVLAAFLSLTGWTLDKAYRDSAAAALRQRLETHIYALLAAADVDSEGVMRLPDTLPEERFLRPGSGLYAQVASNDGRQHWHSPSSLGQKIPVGDVRLAPAQRRFVRIDNRGGPLYMSSLGVRWENPDETRDYTFSVAETLDGYFAEVGRFRRSLWGWLSALAVALLALQGTVLRWGLAPLRRVERDLAAVESGIQANLKGHYPQELRGLTTNLNALLEHERSQRARYRDALANLAHSLKTPLALIRGTMTGDQHKETLRQDVNEQVERMVEIIDYQLQRASTAGRRTLMAPILIEPLVQRLVTALTKVHAEKGVTVAVDIQPGSEFHGEEGDFMELCGNLLDNACKWCRTRVRLSVYPLLNDKNLPAGVALCIEDDGPGIADDRLQQALQRGVRMDSRVEGHGIGLAIVDDIINVYGGQLAVAQSALGGASVQVQLPR